MGEEEKSYSFSLFVKPILIQSIWWTEKDVNIKKKTPWKELATDAVKERSDHFWSIQKLVNTEAHSGVRREDTHYYKTEMLQN